MEDGFVILYDASILRLGPAYGAPRLPRWVLQMGARPRAHLR